MRNSLIQKLADKQRVNFSYKGKLKLLKKFIKHVIADKELYGLDIKDIEKHFFQYFTLFKKAINKYIRKKYGKAAISKFEDRKNLIAFEMISQRYSNIYSESLTAEIESLRKIIRNLVENKFVLKKILAERYAEFYAYRVLYSLSPSVKRYLDFVLDGKFARFGDGMLEVPVIKQLNYLNALYNLFSKNLKMMWPSVKYQLHYYIQKLKQKDIKVVLKFLGAGGVNSNLLYTFIATNIFFKKIYGKNIDINDIFIYDYDSYELDNFFRILPPIWFGKKATTLALALKKEFPSQIKIVDSNSLIDRLGIDVMDKIFLYPRDRKIVKSHIEPDSNREIDIFVGLVNSIERKEIYEAIYENNSNIIEVAFQDNVFHLNLNPKNLSDSSLIRETYGTTDNIFFILAAPHLCFEFDVILANVLEKICKRIDENKTSSIENGEKTSEGDNIDEGGRNVENASSSFSSSSFTVQDEISVVFPSKSEEKDIIGDIVEEYVDSLY